MSGAAPRTSLEEGGDHVGVSHRLWRARVLGGRRGAAVSRVAAPRRGLGGAGGRGRRNGGGGGGSPARVAGPGGGGGVGVCGGCRLGDLGRAKEKPGEEPMVPPLKGAAGSAASPPVPEALYPIGRI